MRKTSQDGGDTTSITSGIENEVKKATTGLAKIKRSSIKKKVQSFSHESDDGVIEPLLQKDKDKTDFFSQSAKFSLSKTKTDVANDKMDDKEKLLPDNKVEKLPLTSFSGVSDLINGTKEGYQSYTCVCTANAIHNHMNSNIFSNSDAIKNSIVTKSQILVEIDGNKQSGYSSAPLIFTTAKIHTDGKNKQMEPVQVTPVPILSTVEGSVVKTSSFVDKQKVIVGTSGKTSGIITASANLGKAREEINNVDVNLKTSAEIINYSKQDPTFSRLVTSTDFPKVSCEDTKGLGTSKLPNLITSAVKVCDSNVITTAAPKITTPPMAMQVDGKTSDKSPLLTKDVPKVQVSDKKGMISTKQEIDFNKNFQLPTCSTLPTINSIIEKDVAGKDKKDSSNIKQLHRQTNAVEEHTETKKNNIFIEPKTNVMEVISSTPKTPTVATDYDLKNEIRKKTGIIHDNISSKPSLTQDKIVTAIPVASVTKTHPSSDKIITSVSTTMPTKISISTVTPNLTQTTTTNKEPNIKTIVDSNIGKIVTSTLTSSSIKSPATAVTPISISSVSKMSLDSKSKMSPKVESVNTEALSSMNTGSAKTSPISIPPVSNVKVESGAILPGKPTTKSIPSEPVITSGVTLSGKTSLSTSKSTTASTSLISPMVKSIPKHISTTAPTIASSNNIVKSNSVIPKKSNPSNDQITGMSSKIRSPISCSGTTGSSTTKPSASVASKTSSNISNSQPLVTTPKLAESTPKTINASKKPSTSSVSSKITQASNVGKTSDNQGVSTKGLSKTAPTTVSPAAVVTTTSQKPSTLNKSIDLRSNELKKDKLK